MDNIEKRKTEGKFDEKPGVYCVRDISQAEKGKLLIDWAESRMPVLMALREKYSKTKPFKGYKVAGCLHVTKETAVLVDTLIAGGANVAITGCNPLSTQDDVAAALAGHRVHRRGRAEDSRKGAAGGRAERQVDPPNGDRLSRRDVTRHGQEHHVEIF